jgi:arginine exporter protein ArgO
VAVRGRRRAGECRLWFVALGFGWRLFAGLLCRPATRRWLDAFVAAIMVETAVRVLAG